MQDKAWIEATKKEVVNIGWSRHFRADWKRLLLPPIFAMVAFIIAMALTTGWMQLVALPLLALFFWGYYELQTIPTKYGKALWEDLKQASQ